MAPIPSCRLEGSRHPVTQRPGPRGQSPSQNSTPGRTPWANCPSQCQPFQFPPPTLLPLSPSFLSLSFTLSLPSFLPHNSAILSLSTQLKNLLCTPACTSVGEKNDTTTSEELYERKDGKREHVEIRRHGALRRGRKLNEKTATGKDSEKWESVSQKEISGGK